jgi:hypothetical protein
VGPAHARVEAPIRRLRTCARLTTAECVPRWDVALAGVAFDRHELLALVRGLVAAELVGADIVELSPGVRPHRDHRHPGLACALGAAQHSSQRRPVEQIN